MCGLGPSIKSPQAQAKNTTCPELSSLTNTTIQMEISPCWSCLPGSPSRLSFCPSACPISQSNWQLQLLAGWLDGDKIRKVQERCRETGSCVALNLLNGQSWPWTNASHISAFWNWRCLHLAIPTIIQLDQINLWVFRWNIFWHLHIHWFLCLA